jgi:hypothetical protein
LKFKEKTGDINPEDIHEELDYYSKGETKRYVKLKTEQMKIIDLLTEIKELLKK